MEMNININLGVPLWWLISAAFILWGYSTIAPHLNAPLFTYWEMMAIRMAIGSLARMFVPIEVKA